MKSLEMISGIFPENIIVEILARLPVKALFRCKSVCKFWCKLPSDKYFIQLYYETSKDPMVMVEIKKSVYIKSTFICVDRFCGYNEFSLDFLSDRVKVRASCNGLLCCASIPNQGVYYICNPMTREFRLLPRTSERPMSRCHPNDEATLVGLAFDSSTHKFKVVLAGYYRSFGRRRQNCLVCMVFDSETSLWMRHVSSRDEEFTHMQKNQVVFVNGSLHWLTSNYSCILVLDLSNVVWRKISLPDEFVCCSGSRIYLLELEGSLSVIGISEVLMSIWVLKDYVREEWWVADRVNLRCIRGFIPAVFPISQTEDYVFLATQRQIMMYSRKNKMWKEIYYAKNIFTYPLWFSAYSFRSTVFPCYQMAEYS